MSSVEKILLKGPLPDIKKMKLKDQKEEVENVAQRVGVGAE